MSLVRWMRKNHTKIMVIVLVVIMVGFVIGASLPIIINQFVNRVAAGKIIATYGDGQKITRVDYREAQTDLNILQQLYASEYLTIVPTPMGIPNYKTLLIGQLIFSDQKAPLISNAMKQSVMRGQLQVTAVQVDDFFIQLNKTTPEVYWLLLNAEANDAGFTTAPIIAENVLKQLIPYITQGRPASQLINALVSEYRVTREQIYSTFAKLIAVVSYIDMITASEDITVDQVRAFYGLKNEKITAEYIMLSTNTDSSKLPEPTDQAINTQFRKYKAYVPGIISDENLFGFGYKLPASVELEYLIVKLKDVEKLIDKPTDENLEAFYQYNTNRFTYEEATDPNDPESEKIVKTRDYSEVMEQIRAGLIQQKSSRQANMIMNDAVEITTAKLSTGEIEKPTSETYRNLAVSLTETAAKLSEKYDVEIFAGHTGRMSRTELASDSVLGSLIVSSQNSTGIRLEKIAFSVEELAETRLGRFDIATPKMFQNIGPMNNGRNTMVSLIRVVAAYPPAAAENVDTTFSIAPPVVGDPDPNLITTFSVKDEVVKDLKSLKAMEIAGAEADKLLTLIEEKGFDDAIKAFNETKRDEEDPVVQTVMLRTQRDKNISSLLDKKNIELSTAGNPSAEMFKRYTTQDAMLTEKLLSFLPEGREKVDDIRKVFAFEPQKSYYIVKSVQKQLASKDDYYKQKNTLALMLDINRSMSLAFVQLSPENLLERTNFEQVNQEEEKQSLTSDEDDQQENGEE